jgi:ubiquinol-cytochrome c reductase cytochrome c subunit
MGSRRVRRTLLIAVLAAVVLTPAAVADPPPIVRPAEQPGTPLLELGSELFAANCATCHGIAGRGVNSPRPNRGASTIQGQGPSLRGVGARAADFYLRTGYMPLGSAHDQPTRQRVQFSEREIRALVAYVASLGGGPPIPTPDPASGDIGTGRELFTEHCSGCHQVVAEGGIMPGAKAPPLDRATPVQIAQAVRIGPYVMPSFPESQISDDQLNSIIAYVLYAKNPQDEGGWGIDHLGPFPEGMVTWLIAMVVLVATCIVIGKRMSQS